MQERLALLVMSQNFTHVVKPASRKIVVVFLFNIRVRDVELIECHYQLRVRLNKQGVRQLELGVRYYKHRCKLYIRPKRSSSPSKCERVHNLQ